MDHDYYDDEPPEMDPDMEEEAISYEDHIPDDIDMEMMEDEAESTEYSLKSVNNFRPDSSDYLTGATSSTHSSAYPQPSVTGGFASPGFDFNYVTKKAPKSELLQDLIAARELSMAKIPSMNALLYRGVDAGSELLVTQREGSVIKVSASERAAYLLSTLPHKEPADEGQGPTKYMSCTLEDESRFYIRRRPAITGFSTGGSHIEAAAEYSGNLLGTSIETLLQESHAKQVRAKLLLDHAESNETGGLDYATSIASVAAATATTTATGDSCSSGSASTSLLWVEKYAPRTFSQLLSLERTNRDVLKALKAWDTYVFNKPAPGTHHGGGTGNKGKSDPYSAVGSYGGADSSGTGKHKSGRDGGEDSDDGSDDDVDVAKVAEHSKAKTLDLRPRQKVILLSGPPGSGKTTLAHVIAKHCGYNVIEVNASDDRSSAVLKDKILRSIQANTISLTPTSISGGTAGAIVGADVSAGTGAAGSSAASSTKPKPNCVILDEIDGIDNRETVEMLCKIIRAPLPSQKDPSNKDAALTRPLICVCNDQYAPALRELRKYCQIFTFTTPLMGRLVQRLKQILSLEGVDLTPSVLSMLCTANGNDIRSCLNTLQFATLQCKEAVDAERLNNNGSNSNSANTGPGGGSRKLQGQQLVSHTLNQMVLHGLKDEQKSAFQIWKVLFNNRDAAALLSGGSVHSSSTQHPSAPAAAPIAAAAAVRGGKDCKPADGALGRLLMSIVDEFDDMDLLIGGIHENILAINYNDPCLTKTSGAFDWLSYADVMAPDHGGHSVFSSAACVAIHMLCGVDHRTQVVWPSKDREMYFKKQEVQSLLQSLVDNRFAGPGSGRVYKHAAADGDAEDTADSGPTHTSVYSSKLNIAMDVISFLVTLIHPRIRSHISSFSSLSMVERHIIHETAQIMVSCGLSFIANSTSSGQQNNKWNGAGRGDDEALKLEPNITQLVRSFCEKSVDAHDVGQRSKASVRAIAAASADGSQRVPLLMNELRALPVMSPDVRNVLHVESRKLLLKQQTDAQQTRDEELRARLPVQSHLSSPKPKPTPLKTATTLVPVPIPTDLLTKKPVTGGKMDSFFKSKKRPVKALSDMPTGTATGAIAGAEIDAKGNNTGVGGTTSKKKKGIHFKFLLGATNAVKRAVNISEFCA